MDHLQQSTLRNPSMRFSFWTLRPPQRHRKASMSHHQIRFQLTLQHTADIYSFLETSVDHGGPSGRVNNTLTRIALAHANPACRSQEPSDSDADERTRLRSGWHNAAEWGCITWAAWNLWQWTAKDKKERVQHSKKKKEKKCSANWDILLKRTAAIRLGKAWAATSEMCKERKRKPEKVEQREPNRRQENSRNTAHQNRL